MALATLRAAVRAERCSVESFLGAPYPEHPLGARSRRFFLFLWQVCRGVAYTEQAPVRFFFNEP
jgi:hypothetical protein